MRAAVAAALSAAVLGVLYAAVSVYWALGGTTLLDTVGGPFQQAAHTGGGGVVALIWMTVLLKLAAAGLGLSAVSGRPELGGRRHRQVRATAWRRHRQARAAAWTAAVILTFYGGVLSVVGWLVQLGVIAAGAHADHRALRWHAFLWDPWFLVWGALLLLALTATRSARPGHYASRH